MHHKQLLFLAFPALLGAVLLAGAGSSVPAGPLVIVGGGGTPKVALARALELAGPEASVAVLPFASSREERGDGSVTMWLEAGASAAENLDHLSPAEASRAIAEAHIIWMPGGDQAVLMEELVRRELVDPIRKARARGAVVGGTSAGAAVMTRVMIARSAEDDALIKARTPLAEGLGLFDGAIVDQHFVRRGRNVRLLQTVLDHPQEIGFGIDERTALVVFPTGVIEVVGDSQVVVYDARRAAVRVRESDGRQAARGVVVDVLQAPDRYVLEPLK